MPAISKRRKAAPTINKNAIQKFGKISKSHVVVTVKSTKKLETHQASTTDVRSHGSKRKAEQIEADESDHAQNVESEIPTTPRKRSRKLNCVEETPTRGTRSLLQAFNISIAEPPKAQAVKKQLGTPPSSQATDRLPFELLEFIDLHSCFLSALSIHYAHNGIFSPADLRTIAQQTTRLWKIREVQQKDIQRLLPLQRGRDRLGQSQDFYVLSDYGQGKICIENPDQKPNDAPIRAVDEPKLNALFRTNLEQNWCELLKTKGAEHSPAGFLADLSLTPITKSSSLKKLEPCLRKGQARLTELKNGGIKVQQAALSVTSGNQAASPAIKPKAKDPFERSADLKSRIFAKQLHQSSLPAPMSAEQIARRSSMRRVLEVAPVLGSMALCGQKHRNDDADEDPFSQVIKNISFSMSSLVQNLQMSLRNPISNEEGARCVRLLAELAPEWVIVREIGKVCGVTVRGGGLGNKALMQRVQTALNQES